MLLKPHLRRSMQIAVTFLFVAGTCIWATPNGVADDSKDDADDSAAETEDDFEWTLLFDGESLKNWKATEYGGEGPVDVEDGEMRIGMGQPLSGVTWDGDVDEIPRVNYEIRLQAKRVEGGDFFCGLTFPVQDDPCTLILGGWGGTTLHGSVGKSKREGTAVDKANAVRRSRPDLDAVLAIQVP